MRDRLDAFVERVSPKLPLITLAIVLVLVVGMGVTVLASQRSATRSDDAAVAAQLTAIGTEVAGCRSDFNVRVTDARAVLDEANTDLTKLTNEGLEASVTGVGLEALIAQAAPARQSVDAARLAYAQVLTDYRNAVGLSNRDQAAFLAQCRASGTTTEQPAPTTTEEP